ncbi:DUF3519 domain-containing protein [Helicobacter pylori]|nr:DUF3519 domain-containing protein [Helicobacter pylori]
MALSLKPAITKNLSQGLATTLSGALKYQWTKFTLGTLYRNAPDRILGVKLPKALNEATAGAALKYHIKRALERSHSISEFSKQLELSAQKSHFSNNTLKIIEELNNGIKQASEELSKKASDLEHAITPFKEFGKNYPEFALKPKEALEKLLQEKNGQVAGAAYREDLGGIDFVWGTPKTKESVGYGLVHVLERREQQALADGLNEAEAKEYALNIVKSIPEVLEKGTKGTDHLGRVFVDYGNKRVGLNNTWNNKDLENHWVISSYELRDTTEKPTHFPTSQAITKEKDIHSLNSVELNPTPKPLTDQEDLLKTSENLNETTPKPTNLSPLEQANAEKLAKLQREQEQSEQEFLKAKEQETKRKEALKKKLEHERGNAGNIESQTKIEVGEDIPTSIQAQIPKSRVRLNEREIYDLDYAIVKAKDLKPSFSTGGTQKRTDMNEEQIKSISNNFDPKKIFGSGGFEDLPIILHDGQVIAGNHRIQGMLNFTPKSRYIYHRAIKEYYNIDLAPDELLVRVPHNRLNNTEINNLAASSNQGRFNSESDHAIAVLSHYEAKLKELDQKLDADSIYSLKNIVAKNLNFDKATHPNVGDSNLALLMFNMPRTKTQGIELLNRWQKEFSNDIKSYEKVKKMFVDNAGSFHNLIHDMNFPNVSLNAYLSDIMDRSFANLKNYQTTSESLKDLSEKFYKTSSLEMFEKSDQNTSDISEILGGAIARFARFDDPSKALFEALKSDNIKKGLKEFKIADLTKDMFNPDSKEFKDIDIYDFTHYLLMVNREPNENNPTLKRLIEAVKDMQKESEKGIKEASKSAEKSEIKERAFKVIEDKEAFLKDLNAIKPTPLPKEIDTESFLNAFNGVKNKENFIKHLKNKPDSAHRLAYLNLVEPTLKEPDITLIFKEQGKEVKKEHIKAFQGDPKTIYYFLVTQDNDNKLITGLKVKPIYIKAEIDKADIIHSFIPQARTLKE